MRILITGATGVIGRRVVPMLVKAGHHVTAVVRSPVTGIVLATEMTGSFTLLLPMLGSCFAAMLVPTLLNDPPIYDSLREQTLRAQRH